MYFDFLVKVPETSGKITTKAKGNAMYVYYEVGREYRKDKRYNVPKRVGIGKLSKADPTMMNFLMRSSILREAAA